jgi:peptidoglycan/LPS O-acetylase OafA/YrhL
MIPEKKHVPVLDSLRAIAALSVCFFHFVCGPIGFIKNETITGIFHFGLYGVQLFFVISGFVIPWSIHKYHYQIKNYFKFLLKRFIRLEPPYLVSIGLVIAFFFIRKLYSDVPDVRLPVLDAKQTLLHLGYLIPFTDYNWMCRVYWTLAIEFQFYLFMGLFYFVIIRKELAIRILGYVAVLAVSFIGSEKFVLFWLPVFLLGNVLFLYLSGRITKYESYTVLTAVFVHIWLFLPYPAFFACLFAVLCILFLTNYRNRFLSWIGRISYSLYLVHAIVGLAAINVMSRYAHTGIMKLVVILAGAGISIFVSYCMYLLVEKPSQKLSSKIKL